MKYLKDCVFCKIANNEIPVFKIWEDEKYLAFLANAPVSEGSTVVIPKKHKDSYIFNIDAESVSELMEAARKVAKILDTKLDGVVRSMAVFEGLEVPHLHVKLFPIYKDKITHTHEAHVISNEELEKVAKKLR
ncbi:MAG TPA: HIT family protein [Candidatus Saccharimonadales bacterium]|nr:HIT family protein [Candidatus Saccharimonadales bacterium]